MAMMCWSCFMDGFCSTEKPTWNSVSYFTQPFTILDTLSLSFILLVFFLWSVVARDIKISDFFLCRRRSFCWKKMAHMLQESQYLRCVQMYFGLRFAFGYLYLHEWNLWFDMHALYYDCKFINSASMFWIYNAHFPFSYKVMIRNFFPKFELGT